MSMLGMGIDNGGGPEIVGSWVEGRIRDGMDRSVSVVERRARLVSCPTDAVGLLPPLLLACNTESIDVVKLDPVTEIVTEGIKMGLAEIREMSARTGTMSKGIGMVA